MNYSTWRQNESNNLRRLNSPRPPASGWDPLGIYTQPYKEEFNGKGNLAKRRTTRTLRPSWMSAPQQNTSSSSSDDTADGVGIRKKTRYRHRTPPAKPICEETDHEEAVLTEFAMVRRSNENLLMEELSQVQPYYIYISIYTLYICLRILGVAIIGILHLIGIILAPVVSWLGRRRDRVLTTIALSQHSYNDREYFWSVTVAAPLMFISGLLGLLVSVCHAIEAKIDRIL